MVHNRKKNFYNENNHKKSIVDPDAVFSLVPFMKLFKKFVKKDFFLHPTKLRDGRLSKCGIA